MFRATAARTEQVRRHLDSALAFLRDHPLALLFAFYVVAKCTLYTKIGLDYLRYQQVENSFFPAGLYLLNPLWLDAAMIAAFVVNKRWAFGAATIAAMICVVHPMSFGYQHYVMSSYMFLWLALRDENHSVMLGRATLSFLYLAATIGKFTPGWISGLHPQTYLLHLDQNPYLILGGELVFGLAFLLPLYAGIFIPACIVIGMIWSISFGITDAVGPIFGMLLTFAIVGDPKRDVIWRLHLQSQTSSGLARRGLVLIFIAYTAVAVLFPRQVYVDRYLLNLSYAQWVPFQLYPSMYTTEIEVTDHRDGFKFAPPHHPARMFFNRTDSDCNTYTIQIVYRAERGRRDFVICDGKLDLLPVN